MKISTQVTINRFVLAILFMVAGGKYLDSSLVHLHAHELLLSIWYTAGGLIAELLGVYYTITWFYAIFLRYKDRYRA